MNRACRNFIPKRRSSSDPSWVRLCLTSKPCSRVLRDESSKRKESSAVQLQAARSYFKKPDPIAAFRARSFRAQFLVFDISLSPNRARGNAREYQPDHLRRVPEFGIGSYVLHGDLDETSGRRCGLRDEPLNRIPSDRPLARWSRQANQQHARDD